MSEITTEHILVIFLVLVSVFQQWQHRHDLRAGADGLARAYRERDEENFKQHQYELHEAREALREAYAKLYSIKTGRAAPPPPVVGRVPHVSTNGVKRSAEYATAVGPR